MSTPTDPYQPQQASADQPPIAPQVQPSVQGYPYQQATPGYAPMPGAMPMPQGGYGYANPTEKNTQGTLALVFGIVSFFLGGLLLGIPALILGRMNMKAAAQGRATNGGQGKAGYILGIINIIFSVIGIIVLIIAIAISAKNGNSSPSVGALG